MAEISIQDRLTLQAWEDPLQGDVFTPILGGTIPAKETWRELMTPNLPLSWL